jgi:prevent-host-death family protein
MSQTTAQQFQRKFGEYQHQARREPVEITRHGRRELVLMSAERYDWLLAASKRNHAVDELPETIVDAVRFAKRPARPANRKKKSKIAAK